MIKNGRILLILAAGILLMICGITNADSYVPTYHSSPYGTVAKGWNFISIPYEAVDGSPSKVLDGIDIGNASLQTWDNVSQTGVLTLPQNSGHLV